jgi:4-amino-4-deoxy-L-arabinose transferase-like glycosyltransferase
MGMNFMTHTLTLTCALAATLGVMLARQSNRSLWAWLAGFALGLMSLVRPLEGLIMAVLVGLWSLGLGGKRLKLAAFIGLVLGTALVGGMVLPYNKALTGSMTTMPINLYTDNYFGKNSFAYGFGPDRGMGWPIDPNLGHSVFDALVNSDLNFFSINIELLGWSIGSLLLFGIFLFSFHYQKSDFLMGAVILAVYIAHFFFFFSGGPDFGARYWYLMIVPFIALSIRGVEELSSRLQSNRATPSSSLMVSFGETRVLTGVLILSCLAIIIFIPWRSIDKYYHYLNMQPDIKMLAKANNFGCSLVLIRGLNQPDYASAAIYNPLDFQASQPIYAYDLNDEVRQRLLMAYANRPVWLVNGPSLTGSNYQVVAGPIPAAHLLSGEENLPLRASEP